jgi:putative transposase
MEDLDIKSLLEKSNTCMSRNIGDVSWSKFVIMLKYKALWNGRRFLQIRRYDPSSKKCSECGEINSELKLKDRIWTCKKCNKEHDRDINAAINILKFGMEQAEFKSSENVNSKISPCLKARVVHKTSRSYR